MKFLLSWLKEYIDINVSAAEIAKILTSIGIEVDAFAPQAKGFNDVVVGTVIDVQKHPNADKLCVAKVRDGADTYQVVCGAPNCRIGIKTAFARVGASLQDREGKTYKIKKGKIRDVESFGMLCSEDELLISNQSGGIIEFADHIKEGADVAEIYGDTLFEVSLTPNLGHCMGLIGIARELSAATETPFRLPEVSFTESSTKTCEKVQVSIVAKDKAPRYSCRLIQNIKMAKSPAWMQERLLASGIRPINSVVDVTNYVALELGQPMHAFDFNKLQTGQIVVREALEGESITSLDGQIRQLAKGDLLICDQNQNATTRPIALAGIIGGANSEVDEQTTDVLLEAAYFEPTGIRRTSKRLGLSTDASRRFERKADPSITLFALERASMLLQAICMGHVCQAAIDILTEPLTAKLLKCRLARINALLGTSLSVSEVENVFKRLNFSAKWDGQGLFIVEVPAYRGDIIEEIDLIEEVARIYGYDNIPKAAPKYQSSLIPHAPIYLFENTIRSRVLAEGLQETITCNLIGPSILKIIKEPLMAASAIVEVLNPTSIEQSILRTSLLPGLLQVAKYNYDQQNHDLALFEVGRIHFKENEFYKEQSSLGILLSGKIQGHHWQAKSRECDFFDLKGLVEDLLATLDVQSPTFKVDSSPIFHSGRQLSVYMDAIEIGFIGEIHPAIIDRLDVPQRIFFAEINLHELYLMKKPPAKIQPLALYPSSSRDLTLTLHRNIPVQLIFDHVYTLPLQFFENMSLLDVYHSPQLGEKQNVTFHLVYRDRNKTIAQLDVDEEHALIVREIEQFIASAHV